METKEEAAVSVAASGEVPRAGLPKRRCRGVATWSYCWKKKVKMKQQMKKQTHCLLVPACERHLRTPLSRRSAIGRGRWQFEGSATPDQADGSPVFHKDEMREKEQDI